MGWEKPITGLWPPWRPPLLKPHPPEEEPQQSQPLEVLTEDSAALAPPCSSLRKGQPKAGVFMNKEKLYSNIAQKVFK